MPQEMLLLHDTIHMNVTLGDPAISDTQVEEALRDAGPGRLCRRCQKDWMLRSANAAHYSRVDNGSGSPLLGRWCTSRGY